METTKLFILMPVEIEIIRDKDNPTGRVCCVCCPSHEAAQKAFESQPKHIGWKSFDWALTALKMMFES